MDASQISILKSSGNKALFSESKLRKSLQRSDADTNEVDRIVAVIKQELYPNIRTKEIYNRAFSLLRKKKSIYASKYKLKKAIYELGPSGFPFERFIGAIFENLGFSVQIGQIMQGECVSHEVDVLANDTKNNLIVECKFHSEQGRNCNVKIPLYVNSRYHDIINSADNSHLQPSQGWVVTNTRFTKDATAYGKCAGLHLLSWSYPKGEALKDKIDNSGLYPITVSSLLTNREKTFLLSRNVVLCRQLLKDKFFLDHLGISENRKKRILNEVELLCGSKPSLKV